MRKVRTYNVIPALPKRLQALREIAYNLWWTWNLDARDLFIRLDREKWEECHHNPVELLGLISQKRLVALSKDQGFLAHLDRVKESLDEYLNASTWYKENVGDRKPTTFAYFSAEFGLHESLPIYSGGLGILSGDHVKSASGLGLPFVAVGLFYSKGYFRQYLNADGWQQEFLHPNDPHNLPLQLERDENDEPIRVQIEYPNGPVHVQVWRVEVGRVTLYLLDTNIHENSEEGRGLTEQLYGGDHEHRIKQEILLGIGGTRILRALGKKPDVYHMNEGHSAFLGIERIRVLVEEEGWTFEKAREAVAGGSIFTTHTPVPAGNDEFHPEMMDHYFKNWYKLLGIDKKTFMALGRQNPHNKEEPFGMTVLALKTTGFANGVSKLHGKISRGMWHKVWPDVPIHEVPVNHITNGVHMRSYVSDQLDEICIRYLGPKWAYEAVDEGHNWCGPDKLPNTELWRVHERRRSRLVTWARERLKKQLIRRGAGPHKIDHAEDVLDPESLTLGFARRFAPYKRGSLLFHDPDRLAHILNQNDRPVQIIFAGKAHPRDHMGKELIQRIVRFAREDRFRKRVVFLEDYDIEVARYLVQGVDVWLNTPRRPMEASGTSGMKAAANGVPNCSILDGWWCEGYDGTNGWAIGQGEDYTDSKYQDHVESRALYDLLEQRIVPMFYKRSMEGVPHDWVEVMKGAMKTAIPIYSTLRMVRDYTQKFYFPAGEKGLALFAENGASAQELWDWKVGLFQHWAQVRVEEVAAEQTQDIPAGTDALVTARVHLGPISAKDVSVQIFSGVFDGNGSIKNGTPFLMQPVEGGDNGIYTYQGKLPSDHTGRYGYEIRIVPSHRHLTTPFVPGLISWG